MQNTWNRDNQTKAVRKHLGLTALLAGAVIMLLPVVSLGQQGTLTDDATFPTLFPVKSLTVHGSSASGGPATSFLKFKLTPNLPVATSGSFVGKATLTLYVGSLTTVGSFDVYRVTSSWQETDTSGPTYDAANPLITAVPVLTAGGFITVDLTTLVQQWLGTDGLGAGGFPNYGIALVANTATTSFTFDSKEATTTSHLAQLAIVLNHVAVADTATNFSGPLAGDVTGTQTATVVSSLGGQTVANVANATTMANAATDTNTAGTIVKRDGSGNFSAGAITASLNGNATSSTNATTAATANALAGSATVNGNQVNGALLYATIAGSSVTGNLAASQVSGDLGNATIAGNKITSPVANATNATTAATANALSNSAIVPGSQVSGDIPGRASSVTGTIGGNQVSSAVAEATHAVNADSATNATNATTAATANALASSASINGDQVSGDLTNATIAGNRVSSPVANATNATTADAARSVASAAQDTDISLPTAGQIYFNTTSHVFRQYDGSAWKTIDAGLASQLSSAGTLNATTNPVDWSQLKNVPSNVASGYSAGGGINIDGSNVISNTGVLSVGASGPLSSSGGPNPSISLNGVVPLVNGGTGSPTQNFVDLTTNQTIGGDKTFTGNQSVNGSVTATSFSGNGSGLTNVDAATLGGQPANVFARLSGGNNFTGNQTIINGNVGIGTTSPGYNLDVASGTVNASTFRSNEDSSVILRSGRTNVTQPAGTSTSVSLIGGDAYSGGFNFNGSGANLTVRGPSVFGGGFGAMNGGGIFLTAGNGLIGQPGAAAGGNIVLTAGNSQNLPGGNVILTPGSGSQNGNVGIGIISPGAALTVTKNSNGWDNGVRLLDQNGSNEWNLHSDTNGNFMIGRSGQDALNVGASGNVGIGTASPGSKLTVAGTIESTSGGIKFPDSSTQTTAAADPSIFARLSGGNSFTGNQSVNGSVTATSFTGSGSGLTSVDAATLGGQPANAFARLNAANNFSGDQSITGNVTATGTIGIGTTSPQEPLHVIGANSAIRVQYPGSPVYGRFWSGTNGVVLEAVNSHPVDGGIIFYVNGPEVMRLSPSGNVGIGTTSPTQKLEVAGNVKISGPGNALIFPDSTVQTSAAADPSLFARLSGGNSFTGNQSVNGSVTATSFTGNGSTLTAVDAATLGGQPGSAYARLNAANNFSADQSITGNLSATGSVGIGTTNPTQKLEVGNGNIRLFRNDGGRPAFIMNLSGAAWTQLIQADGRLDFIPVEGPGTAVVSLANSGNVGIGTTTPSTLLHLSSPVSPVIRVDNTSSGRSYSIANIAGSDPRLSFIDNMSNAERLTIDAASGNVGIGLNGGSATFEVRAGGTTLADAWTVRSSARFKTNIRPIHFALDKVMQLRGVAFNWKNTRQSSVGFIAEEVARVLPEAVEYEGNGRDIAGLDYNKVTPLLVEAIKAQQQKIVELEQRTSRSEARNAEQEARLATLEKMLKAMMQTPLAAPIR